MARKGLHWPASWWQSLCQYCALEIRRFSGTKFGEQRISMIQRCMTQKVKLGLDLVT